MTVIVTDNKLCYSVYQPDKKILITTFKGVVNYALMRHHMENVLRFSKDNQVLGGLIDFRLIRGSYFKIFDYLEKEVYPKLLTRGFNVQAFIISDDLLTANVTEKLKNVLQKQEGKINLFRNYSEAEKWLEEKLKI
jgi:hypothetical protein